MLKVLEGKGFHDKVYTPSPSFHVKISFVQICFGIAPFSGSIYCTTIEVLNQNENMFKATIEILECCYLALFECL